ncbi:substrate-specific component CbrT of predicted cobalamin ECF transporter [Lachnospiraceae bacterium KM106-2]|nr:substrate-specific component CbrT of predicted cobalamin ECF transporter [Lachnospiraceae bacterium KM106-2]
MINTKLLVSLAMLTSILLLGQIALAPLPNIEIVSLLIILYTLLLGKYVYYIIYGFAVLEGLVYGFGLWWFMYLYVWTILAIITMIFRKNRSPVFWAIVSGLFGLSFGFLCSFPYFITGGIGGGVAFFLSGIPFDITHSIGNVIVALILFQPLYSILKRFLPGTES